jgi:hypothetical protein
MCINISYVQFKEREHIKTEVKKKNSCYLFQQTNSCRLLAMTLLHCGLYLEFSRSVPRGFRATPLVSKWVYSQRDSPYVSNNCSYAFRSVEIFFLQLKDWLLQTFPR